jgi:hypothetical protein
MSAGLPLLAYSSSHPSSLFPFPSRKEHVSSRRIVRARPGREDARVHVSFLFFSRSSPREEEFKKNFGKGKRKKETTGKDRGVSHQMVMKPYRVCRKRINRLGKREPYPTGSSHPFSDSRSSFSPHLVPKGTPREQTYRKIPSSIMI